MDNCCLPAAGPQPLLAIPAARTSNSLPPPLPLFYSAISRPMLDAFAAKLDRTLAARLASFGAHLDSRHAVLVRGLLDNAHSPEVRYNVGLLASYMPETAIDPPLREALLALRRETSEAAYLSATAFLGPELDRAAEAARTQPPATKHLRATRAAGWRRDGGYRPARSTDVDRRRASAALGWDRPASRSKLLKHSFAIGLHEVTYAEFQAYRRATGAAESSLPDNCPSPRGPMVAVPYYEMLRYCRWLSEQNGFSDDEVGAAAPGRDHRGDEL